MLAKKQQQQQQQQQPRLVPSQRRNLTVTSTVDTTALSK